MDLGKAPKDTLMEALGIEIVQLEEDRVAATMPVTGATRQPFGMLHGGASVALAETAATVGTYNLIDREHQQAVGLEINANHLRGISEGLVRAVAVPLHKGRRTMVWDIKISDEKERLICVSRCTMAIIDLK